MSIAVISLIETCKLNAVDPFAYLPATLSGANTRLKSPVGPKRAFGSGSFLSARFPRVTMEG
ncbi:transposase domain-containing protein [Rhizobium laguerreae]|uniref:transposase domain-containing protein n=1 Tax=Rhizobium laguerreae TaxID=1076926 RepID=UPI003704517D